jgi:hypothetical protein
VRQRLKLIVFAAISAALTVAGMSIAAGGGGGSGGSGSSTDSSSGLLPPKVMHFEFDRNVADVMIQVHQAIAQKAPEIADPIIQKAQDNGDITSDQADKLRAAAQAIADGKRPDVDKALLSDADVRKVVRDAFDAARQQAPAIAEPIIKKAVDDKKITSAQADKIREMLKNGPPFGPPPFIGPGPGFKHGPDVFGFGPGVDKDVAAVLDDIHQAVEKKESAIAEPIIKKALDDGKITSAQADALRNHRPPGFDRDVFAVLSDIHKAVAKEASDVAGPIIDKAVADKKITSAQADKIRQMLKNEPPLVGKGLRFHVGPDNGPGLHWEGPGGSGARVLPGGAALELQPGGKPA